MSSSSARPTGSTPPSSPSCSWDPVAATRYWQVLSQVNLVTREAYSREVVSSGFWFGDRTCTHGSTDPLR